MIIIAYSCQNLTRAILMYVASLGRFPLIAPETNLPYIYEDR